MASYSYAAIQRRNPRHRLAGLATVLLLHVVLFYALLNSLGHRMVDVFPSPLKIAVLPEVKTVVKPPPPPPPELIKPPPPYIPPPLVNIAEPASDNAITASPVPPPAVVARPTPPPAPVVPDHDVSEVPIGGAAPVYPARMLAEQREGWASVSCVVDTSGETSSCAIVASQGGSSFGDSALAFAQSQRYRPATHNGQPVVARKTWKLVFSLS